MKILVTGGCGFIGHHLVNSLTCVGHEVEVWDNLSTGKKERLPEGTILKIIDITKDELPTNNFDCVFHLASPTSVPESIDNPEKYYEGCFGMTQRIFNWSLNNGVKKFTFSSTSAIYGDSENIPFSEDHPELPMSPYAKYKLESEKFLNKDTSDCSITVMRFFNVFGEEQPSSGSYSPAIAKFISQYSNGEPITVTGDGLQTRDYVYVKDIVRALVSTVKDNGYKYELFNVGSGVENKIIDIANYFRHKIIHIEKRDEPKRSCSDVNKIKNLLGWESKTTILSWLVENKIVNL
jgi:UDP-glucose 4-epimerase